MDEHASAPLPELERLRRREPFLWVNPSQRRASEALPELALSRRDIDEAERRLRRFAPFLAELFGELGPTGGVIESALIPAPTFGARLADRHGSRVPGRMLVKADHALPVAGSVKARGGVYEVLCLAEQLAIEGGLLSTGDPYTVLGSPEARALFGRHAIAVGSTGNLGLSIGIMGAALGFTVRVHMSTEAKEWKKERLRARGVTVVEHESDYGRAVAAGRAEAAADPDTYFVDDENSERLFLGYSVAALRLERRIAEMGIAVDEAHPLFVYLPCGVGGAPGGITFGLKHVYGDHVHCFFAEPCEAPCMLLGLLTGLHERASVYDVGLRLETDADGLAVSRPSRLAGRLVGALVSGCYTLNDAQLYALVLELYEAEGLEVEPSASAGCAGPLFLTQSRAGRSYLRARGLEPHLDAATHLIWTTGGLFVPPERHEAFRRRGRAELAAGDVLRGLIV